MTAEEQALIAAVRKQRAFKHRPFDDDTQFVEKVLKWLVDERRNGRLADGLPFTLIRFDFAAGASAALGCEVALYNGGVVPGAFHLCSETLRRAVLEVGASGLATMAAHQDMLAQKQLAGHTSVTFNPVTGAADIRLACTPMTGSLEMRLAGAIAPGWAGQGLEPLVDALDVFHARLKREAGVGALFFDGIAVRANIRSFYRKAMYLHLIYQLGLTEENGYRVVASDRDVSLRDLTSQKTARLTVTGARSLDPAIAEASFARLQARATTAAAKLSIPVHMSCIACPSDSAPGTECGTPPLSLRHRHIESAQ